MSSQHMTQSLYLPHTMNSSTLNNTQHLYHSQMLMSKLPINHIKSISLSSAQYQTKNQSKIFAKELRVRDWKVDVDSYIRKLEANDHKMNREEFFLKLADQAKIEEEIEFLKNKLYFNKDFNLPNLYRTFDIDQNGDITVQEFQQILKNYFFLEAQEREITNLFNLHSQDFHGFIQENSFKTIFLPFLVKNKEPHVLQDVEQEEQNRLHQHDLMIKSRNIFKEKGKGRLNVRIRQAYISKVKEFEEYFKYPGNGYSVKITFGDDQILSTKHNHFNSIWNEDIKLKVFNETQHLNLQVYLYINKTKTSVMLGQTQISFTEIKNQFNRSHSLELTREFSNKSYKKTGTIQIEADYVQHNEITTKNDPGDGVLYIKPIQAETIKEVKKNKPFFVTFQLQDQQVTAPIKSSEINEQKQIILFRNISKYNREELQNTLQIKLMRNKGKVGPFQEPPKLIGKGEIDLLDHLKQQEHGLQNHFLTVQINNDKQMVGKLNLQLIYKTKEKDKLPIRPFLQSTKLQIHKLMEKHFEAEKNLDKIAQRVIESELDLDHIMREIDTNKSETIEINELNNILKKYGKIITIDQLLLLFIRLDQFDLNSQGKITRIQFLQNFYNRKLDLQD